MNRRSVSLILVVLVLLAATPAVARMMGYGGGMGPGMMYARQGQPGYGMGPGMMYGYGAGADPKVLREAFEMRQEYAEQTYSLHKEYFEDSQRLAMELAAKKPNKTKVNDLAKSLKTVWGKLFDASLELQLKMAAKGLGGYGMMGMGPGMMHGMGPGMMGYGMGPGMMGGYGWQGRQGYGIGPGMMGGYGN